jgi:hypothetical protein
MAGSRTFRESSFFLRSLRSSSDQMGSSIIGSISGPRVFFTMYLTMYYGV